MKEYTLSVQELATVNDLRAQEIKLRAEIERLQGDLNAVNGAFQGVKILIAQQQGLVETKSETLRFTDDFTRLIVEG